MFMSILKIVAGLAILFIASVSIIAMFFTDYSK